MGKRPASSELIEGLINRSKRTIRDCEQLYHDVEKTKAIFEIISDSNKYSLELLRLTLEILSGGVAGMHECIIGLCRMLQTNSVYEKRYQMQTINLNQFEWCKYMMGKDSKGVFEQYCNLFLECTDNATVFYLNDVRDKIRALGAKCNFSLRNITAHYDNPSTIYQELIKLQYEDEYVQRIGDQMEIYDKIIVFVRSIFYELQTYILFDKNNLRSKPIPKFEIQAFINDKMAEFFLQRNELQITVNTQLATAWDEIESCHQNHYRCKKAIEFFRHHNIDLLPMQNMLSLFEFGWIVTFMRSDLVCAMNSYLNASTMIDRSVCLHRMYMIETAALTHLYGYDDKHRQKSIWYKIKRITEFTSVPELKQIEQQLAECTNILDCNRRNMYTHYLENGLSNISRRWLDFQKMDHVKELFRFLKLVNLCKDIYLYTLQLLSAIRKAQEKKTVETQRKYSDMISKIRDIGVKTNNQELIDMSEKLQTMIDKFQF